MKLHMCIYLHNCTYYRYSRRISKFRFRMASFWVPQATSVDTSRRATSNPRSPPFSTNCACQPFDPLPMHKSIKKVIVSSSNLSFPDEYVRFLPHLGTIKIQGFIFTNRSEPFLAECVEWWAFDSYWRWTTLNDLTICKCSFHHYFTCIASGFRYKTKSLLFKLQVWPGKFVDAPQSSATQGFQEL